MKMNIVIISKLIIKNLISIVSAIFLSLVTGNLIISFLSSNLILIIPCSDLLELPRLKGSNQPCILGSPANYFLFSLTIVLVLIIIWYLVIRKMFGKIIK